MQTATYHPGEKTFRIVALLFSLTVLVMQFILIQNGTTGASDTLARTIRFFSFMTILTNILVAITYFLPLAAPASSMGRFFAGPGAQSAVLVYIVVVCLGYHFLLAGIWHPEGLQFFVDKSLHYIVPILYVAFYFLFVHRGTLAYSAILNWLLYPFFYLLYVMSRGLVTGEYPYPFLDLGKHAAGRVGLTVLLLFVVYVTVSLVVVWWYKRVKNRRVST